MRKLQNSEFKDLILSRAVDKSNISEIKNFLDNNPNYNYTERYNFGETVIVHLLKHDDTKCVLLLLNYPYDYAISKYSIQGIDVYRYLLINVNLPVIEKLFELHSNTIHLKIFERFIRLAISENNIDLFNLTCKYYKRGNSEWIDLALDNDFPVDLIFKNFTRIEYTMTIFIVRKVTNIDTIISLMTHAKFNYEKMFYVYIAAKINKLDTMLKKFPLIMFKLLQSSNSGILRDINLAFNYIEHHTFINFWTNHIVNTTGVPLKDFNGYDEKYFRAIYLHKILTAEKIAKNKKILFVQKIAQIQNTNIFWYDLIERVSPNLPKQFKYWEY